MGALPPNPRSLTLSGNQEGQEKRRAESMSPAPPSSTHLGAQVALQQWPYPPGGQDHHNRVLRNKGGTPMR